MRDLVTMKPGQAKKRKQERLERLRAKYVSPFAAAAQPLSSDDAAFVPFESGQVPSAGHESSGHVGEEEHREGADRAQPVVEGDVGEDDVDFGILGADGGASDRSSDAAEVHLDEDDADEVRIRSARLEIERNDFLLDQDFSDPLAMQTGILPSVDEQENNIAMISDFFVGLQARREVPFRVMMDIIDFLKNNSESVNNVLMASAMPTFRSMRSRALKKAPGVKVDVLCEDRDKKNEFFEALTRYPRKVVRERNLTTIYSLYYQQLSKVWEWHAASHPKKGGLVSRAFDMSLDGIPESRSSGLSLDVLSVRFTDCQSVYSIAIMQPGKKGLGNKDEATLKHFLEDLRGSDLRLRFVIADAPKRASLQGLKTHAAKKGCPYCFAK